MTLLVARDLAAAPPSDGPAGGPREVVSGFSLGLDRGEWVALTGGNGCGKTTLMLALAGLWPARRGTLLLEDVPFGPGAGRSSRSRVAVILQDPSCQLLQPTVAEELAFSARNIGLPEREVEEGVAKWVSRFGLAGELARDPQHLSAGKQQLVLLAAALAARPLVLMADEPAAHLDSETRTRVLQAVRSEVEGGLAVLWVTQDAEELGAADREVRLAPEEVPPGRAPAPDVIVQVVAMMTLKVSALRSADGPCVRTPEPFDVPIASRGVTALEGANGVGKSVMLGVAAGALDLAQVGVEGGPGMSPVFSSQHPELEIFEERVADEVAYGAVSRGMSREDALASARGCFETLGLGGDFTQRRTWSLSGGEKRLVTAVSALVAPAGLRVLDEPTAGLDPRRRAALATLILAASREVPVLVASQDSDWLEQVRAARWRVPGGARGPAPKSQQKNGLTGPCEPA